jgi:nucleoside-diphosphate-sugar epimerase
MTNQRVIVTGGSGFVGTNLVSNFIGSGWQVINFDICEPKNPAHANYWKKVDLLDQVSLIEQTVNFAPSVFLHFGARTDMNEKINLEGYAQNIEGTRNVVEAIRRTPTVRRAIFASSQLVCQPGYVPRDEFDYHPNSLYGRSKVLCEKIIRSAGDIKVIWTIVRPTSLWGPWFGVPFLDFFQVIRKNRYFHMKGKKPVKQWGFIGNTVYQIIKILQAPAAAVHSKTLYLADYSPVCLREFADQVRTRLGVKPIREMPAGLLKCAARFGDLAQLLGWAQPPLTSYRYRNIVTPEIQDLSSLHEITGSLPYTVEEGIELTVEWLLSCERRTASISLK